jgi:hypothetical protein
MKDMMRHPSHALADVSDEVMAGGRMVAKRPMSAFGIIMLVLGILGFVWMFPELQRYMKIERM